MFDRRSKQPPGPLLLDRILESGCRRVAVLGLHRKAGARTVISALVAQMGQRGLPIAVTSVPRVPTEEESEGASEPATRVRVPPGAVLATASQAATSLGSALELVEGTSVASSLGSIGVYRARSECEVELHGPDEPGELEEVLGRLEHASEGPLLVDGGWDRRAVLAPGVTDGLVLVLASGYSATPERSAAAARYHFETLVTPAVGAEIARSFEDATASGAVTLLDAVGNRLGLLPPGLEDPVAALQSVGENGVAVILLSHGLNDEFMMPLVRSSFRCTLVVRDATRIGIAPVYHKAWLKGGGRILVVRPARVLAVATNPVNVAGPDAQAEAFLRVVASAFPNSHVHDVVLESARTARRPAWKLW